MGGWWASVLGFALAVSALVYRLSHTPQSSPFLSSFQGDFSEYQRDLMARNGGMEPRRPKFRPLPTV